MRYFLLAFVLAIVAVVGIAGFRGSTSRKPPIEIFPDMDRQPKLRPQARSEFWPDGRTSRLPVTGTISRTVPMQVGEQQVYLFEDHAVNTGRLPGTTNYLATNPFPITAQFLARGHERFNIHCAPCHGQQGDGKGVTVKLGMAVIADLHDIKGRRVPQQPDGQMFETISHGKGVMQAYAGQISVQDRWAIIAYVRVLQRSRLASIEDVPSEMRSQIPGAVATVPQPKQ